MASRRDKVKRDGGSTVLQRLRKDIMQYKYQNGEKLKEIDAAERYSCSRAAIRSAVVTLEKEGLIKIHKNGTKTVECLSVQDIDDLYDMRRYIEISAVKRIMQSGKRNLTKVFEAANSIYASAKNTEEMLDADINFHTAIIEASKNKALLQAWNNISSVARELFSLNMTESAEYKTYFNRTFEERHVALVGALLQLDDEEEAIGAFQKHLDEAQNASVDMCKRLSAVHENALLMDFGSTSVKYAVYNPTKDEILHSEKTDFPPRIANADANITEVSVSKIDEIIDSLAVYARENNCTKIYISVQMHGYIIKDGDRFLNYVSWQDKRSLNGSFEKFPKEKVDFTSLGTTYKPNLPLISLYGQNLEGKEYFTLGSYIAYRLTGVNKTHITDSAASGFYNADTAELVNPLNYPMTFAKSTNVVEVVGKCGNIDVYAPVGDHQVTFLGLGIRQGETLLNISTATQISTVSDKLSEDYECRPFFSNGRLCTVSGLIGGMVIRAKQQVGKPYSHALAEELAKNYGAALSRMPNDGGLVIGGGATVYFKDLIEAVAEKIGSEYRITEELSAFAGLVRIVKGDY